MNAYVVGGAVRDLLLGLKPKDFDVATNADPEDVHKLFRRSRLIGRRFKLVHVMFGRDTVEVSTFRARTASETDEQGRVLRDNIYGTREDDAAPRLDHQRALLRPLERDRPRLPRRPEGPAAQVRAHHRRSARRAIARTRCGCCAPRFAAKLGFTLDDSTRAPIAEMAPLLENVPPARLFDEMLKLLLSGHAATSLRQLRNEGLHHGLLPLLDVILEQPLGERFVTLALAQTDERVRTERPVSPAFLFAALLWHEVLAAWKAAEKSGVKPIPALHKAMDAVLDIQTDKLAIPRRFTAVMKEIWRCSRASSSAAGAGRLRCSRTRHSAPATISSCCARPAAKCPRNWPQWWEKFQHAGEDERNAMLMAPRRANPSAAGAGGARSRPRAAPEAALPP